MAQACPFGPAAVDGIADVAVSAVAFGSGKIASADLAVGAVERGLEILGAALECLESRDASARRTGLGETVARLVVELGGYDSVVVWRVDGLVLTPVSAAFANDTEPTGSELTRLASNPPCLEECGLDIAALRDPDLAATGRVGGLGGPMDPVLAPLSCALAAVKSASHPTFVLQAICRQRRVEQLDRDLLLVFAQLAAALSSEPGASELLHRWRARARHVPSRARARQRAAARGSPPELERLTVRQREVMAYALTGASYAAMADGLGLSVDTIKSHMLSIRRKLGLRSRAQLIARYGAMISGDQRNR